MRSTRQSRIMYLILVIVVGLLLYLLLESRQRSRHIDNALKEIPTTN